MATEDTCYNLPLDWRVKKIGRKTIISEHYAQIVQAPIYIMHDMTILEQLRMKQDLPIT